MKKSILTLVLALSVASLFSACKKEYACTCTVSTTSKLLEFEPIESTTFINATGRDARKTCEAGSFTKDSVVTSCIID